MKLDNFVRIYLIRNDWRRSSTQTRVRHQRALFALTQQKSTDYATKTTSICTHTFTNPADSVRIVSCRQSVRHQAVRCRACRGQSCRYSPSRPLLASARSIELHRLGERLVLQPIQRVLGISRCCLAQEWRRTFRLQGAYISDRLEPLVKHLTYAISHRRKKAYGLVN